MPNEIPKPPTDETHLLSPVFIAAGVLLAAFPVMHPYGTCADWLVMWGQSSRLPYWSLIHQMAMCGFGLIAGIGAIYVILAPRSVASIMGGASLVGGGLISAISIPIHATAISSLGLAFIAAGSEPEKKMIHTMADSYIAYDMAAVSTASMMVTVGFCFLVFSLYQRRVLSWLPALMFFGLSLTWTFQYHKVFNRMGFSVPERVHWGSLCLLLGGLGVILFLRGRAPHESRASAPLLATPAPSAASIAD